MQPLKLTFDPDLLLLHAPSVYDFRERAILYGPVSDMVPSSTVFEMYPLGFLTIASYLHAQGMRVRIANLALRMMNDRCLPHWSIEFSPESHDQAVRNAQEGEADYTTAEMEAMLQEALRLRCSRLDVFFMIGLPGQTLESVRDTVDYCERLFRLGDRRLSCDISPMGPFLDPGSRGFEEPGRFGSRLFARTLEEHRQLLVQPTWERILNYETKWMTRRELVDATYDAAERLNELKIRHGRISSRRGRRVAANIAAARALRNRLEATLASRRDPDADPALRGEIARFSMSTVCDKRELFSRPRLSQFRLMEVARILGRALHRSDSRSPPVETD